MQATKMVEEEKNTKLIYIVPDSLEEIFLRLPSKSILKFKIVSKQWRSILESKMFVERRMNVKKTRRIIAAYNCDCGDRPRIIRQARLDEWDDEVIVYIHFRDAIPSMNCDARPLMTCDGLVCIAEPESIIVLNPSTGQLLRFPSAPDPVSSRFINGEEVDFIRGNWVMGFGRDKVTGSFKVIKMCIFPMEGGCDVLDVESGEWTNLKLYPFVVGVSRKSVCVSGSIYWLSCASYKIGGGSKILALDLHTQESHFVSVPDKWVSRYTHIANLEDRLTIADTRAATTLEICSMDAHQEIWSKTYSIALAALDDLNLGHSSCLMSFTPLAVSKQGNLLFYNNDQWLFIYYPETHEIRCLSTDTSVVSSYVENLVPLRSEFGHQAPAPDSNKISTSSCSFLTKHPDPRTSVYHSNYSLKLSNICLW